MPFQIKDNDEVFSTNQSHIFETDINAIIAGIGGDGVVSGCAVTAQGSPNMTCAVAAGTVRIAGAYATVASGNVTITTAHATLPRIDIVVVNSSGTKSVTAGTAAANPKMPDIPASSIILAAVYVPAADTTIASDQITDKRLIVAGLTALHVMAYGARGDGTTDDTSAIQATIDALPSTGGVVLLGASHVISAPLTIRQDNVTLRGGGKGNPVGSSAPNPIKGGSRLLLSAGFTGSHALDISHASRALTGVRLEDFLIDGTLRTASAVNGIYFSAYRSAITHVWVYGMSGNGIVIQSYGSAYPGAAYDNIVYGCRFELNALDGMSLVNYASDNLITDCIIDYNATDGIAMDATSTANLFLHCYIYNSTGKAVNAANAFQLKFIGCRLQNCNGGIYMAGIAGYAGFTITGCTFRDLSDATDNTTDAINITMAGAASGGIIAGCDFYTDTGNGNTSLNRMRYGVNIANANLIGCVIGPLTAGFRSATSTFGTALLNNLGTDTLIDGVPGYTRSLPDARVGAACTDDFLGGSTSSGAIGKLGWFQGGGTYTNIAAVANHPGVGRLDTGASSGTVCWLRLGSSSSALVLPADYFDLTFIVRLNTNDANTAIRFGLTNDNAVAPPAAGVYIEKDFADTQWFGVARASSTQSRTAALATVTTGWLRGRVRRVDASTVGFSLDGGTELTLTSNIPVNAQAAWVQITNNAAAAKTVDVDYFELAISRMTR